MVFGVVEFVVGYCVVEDEMCVVYQMVMVGVVDVVVVLEVVEEVIVWIDVVWMVEGYCIGDVFVQECG